MSILLTVYLVGFGLADIIIRMYVTYLTFESIDIDNDDDRFACLSDIGIFSMMCSLVWPYTLYREVTTRIRNSYRIEP